MFNVGKSGKNLQSSPSTSKNRPHTNYSRQRSINKNPRFKSSVKFKKNTGRFSDKKHPVDFAVVKELDEETNLYYYGARYLDPRTSRWIAGDPAIWQGDYIPSPGQSPDKLGGMGGLYNTFNLHAYGYAANNPVKYTDPDGRTPEEITGNRITILAESLRNTINHLDTMINDLNEFINGNNESVSPDMSQYAMQWLGIDLSNAENAVYVAGGLRRARDLLASKTIDDFRYDPDNWNYVAYLREDEGFRTIYLTPIFFIDHSQAEGDGRYQTREGTLFHEATHHPSVLNTQDLSYNRGNARFYASIDRYSARNNALNWEMFFYHYTRRR